MAGILGGNQWAGVLNGGGGGALVRGGNGSGASADVRVEEVATYTPQPGDTLRGRVQLPGGERLAIVTADHRVILVPQTGLVGAQAAPAANGGKQSKPVLTPEQALERRRKLALYAVIGLGLLTTAGTIIATVIASKEKPEAPVDFMADDAEGT